MNKKLYRDEYHKVLGGVCSGLADYFEMDVTIVRLLFAFSFFVMGVGLGTYIILWIVLPRKGYPFNNFSNFNNPTVDYTVPPQQTGGQFNTPPPPPQGKPFGNNTWAGAPYSSNPVQDTMPKQKSHAGIIIGAILIVIGAAFLIDNFDLLPNFDLWRLWPGIFVLIGGGLILSGQQKSWAQQNFQAEPTEDAPAPAPESSTTTEDTKTAE